MSELTLVDTSTVFWPHYFATRSELDAYMALVEMSERATGKTVFCLDGPAESLERRKLLPEYKSGRQERPEEARRALSDAIERMRDLGTAFAQLEGWEADDCIATLTKQGLEHGYATVRVVSSDKDLMALVRQGVQRVELVRKRETLDAAAVERITGVPPELVCDWLALGGDSADCIPGCPGVGPGKAAKLLQAFRGGLPALKAASRSDILSVRGIGDKIADALAEWFAAGGDELSTSLTLLRDWLDLDLTTTIEPGF